MCPDLVRAPRPTAFLSKVCVTVLGPTFLPAPGLDEVQVHSLLRRAFATLRSYVGLNDPMDDRLHASHGWLLPASEAVRARRAADTAGAEALHPPDSRGHAR